MELFFLPTLNLQTTETFISGSEAKHIQRVLRKSKGDVLSFTNGLGYLFQCLIIASSKDGLQLKIEGYCHFEHVKPQIHLYLGKLHNHDRLEYAAEKCTELGVNSISIVKSDFSQPHGKLKLQRIEQKVIGALKQSKRVYLPTINQFNSLDEALKSIQKNERSLSLIAHEKQINTAKKYSILNYVEKCEQRFDHIHIFIGPEGGFSSRELNEATINYCFPIGLGSNVLRAETAATMAVGAFTIR